MSNKVQLDVEKCIKEFNFDLYGFAELGRPKTMDNYTNWINEKKHGNMAYLEQHIPFKEKPSLLLDSAKSSIVIARNYIKHPYPDHNIPKDLNVSLYARGKDYHFWLKKELSDLCDKLKLLFPDNQFISFSDSSPVLERDLALKAGLGWFGKNTCLINKEIGSFFLIGEVYTDLILPYNNIEPHNHCGTCTKCIDVCPTNAIDKDGGVDARKCISYLNIESKDIPDDHLKEQMGDQFFGCDLCQSICPWNTKKYKKELIEAYDFDRGSQIENLKEILTLSNKALDKKFKETPFSRPRGRGLKRNALIVIGNQRLVELKEEVRSIELLDSPLKDLASWTLKKLT